MQPSSLSRVRSSIAIRIQGGAKPLVNFTARDPDRTARMLEPVFGWRIRWQQGLTPFSHGDYQPGGRFCFLDPDGIEYEVVSYR
jgi:hypothetical protein